MRYGTLWSTEIAHVLLAGIGGEPREQNQG
jgi:hypothetical protein